MRDVSAAEIKTALYRKMSLVFDLLRDEFSEDDLLGEVFAADDDAVAMGASGGHYENEQNKDKFNNPALSREKTARRGRGTQGCCRPSHISRLTAV